VLAAPHVVSPSAQGSAPQNPDLQISPAAHFVQFGPQNTGSSPTSTQTAPVPPVVWIAQLFLPIGQWHAPSEQTSPCASPIGDFRHALPHSPQFVSELPSCVSHPLAGSSSQLPHPSWHSVSQLELTQSAFWFGPLGHGEPQPPQLFTLLVVSTQLSPQGSVGGVHESAQFPLSQNFP
jgi:hypothetical protein